MARSLFREIIHDFRKKSVNPGAHEIMGNHSKLKKPILPWNF